LSFNYEIILRDLCGVKKSINSGKKLPKIIVNWTSKKMSRAKLRICMVMFSLLILMPVKNDLKKGRPAGKMGKLFKKTLC
jgi:hypothetical protein